MHCVDLAHSATSSIKAIIIVSVRLQTLSCAPGSIQQWANLVHLFKRIRHTHTHTHTRNLPTQLHEIICL